MKLLQRFQTNYTLMCICWYLKLFARLYVSLLLLHYYVIRWPWILYLIFTTWYRPSTLLKLILYLWQAGKVCLMCIDCSSFYVFFLLDFEIVPIVWYFMFFIIWKKFRMSLSNINYGGLLKYLRKPFTTRWSNETEVDKNKRITCGRWFDC